MVSFGTIGPAYGAYHRAKRPRSAPVFRKARADWHGFLHRGSAMTTQQRDVFWRQPLIALALALTFRPPLGTVNSMDFRHHPMVSTRRKLATPQLDKADSSAGFACLPSVRRPTQPDPHCPTEHGLLSLHASNIELIRRIEELLDGARVTTGALTLPQITLPGAIDLRQQASSWRRGIDSNSLFPFRECPLCLHLGKRSKISACPGWEDNGVALLKALAEENSNGHPLPMSCSPLG